MSYLFYSSTNNSVKKDKLATSRLIKEHTSLSVAGPTLTTKVKNTSLQGTFIIQRQETISSAKASQYVALDCEMVGVGPDSSRSVLARISIVNYFGSVLYDEYVRPVERITDFRTKLTGITPTHLRDAKPLTDVLFEVDAIIKDKVIIGHGLENDFKVNLRHSCCLGILQFF